MYQFPSLPPLDCYYFNVVIIPDLLPNNSPPFGDTYYNFAAAFFVPCQVSKKMLKVFLK